MSERAPEDHEGLTGAADGDPHDDPQTQPAADEAVEDEVVRENAQTSLDQPSDDVG